MAKQDLYLYNRNIFIASSIQQPRLYNHHDCTRKIYVLDYKLNRLLLVAKCIFNKSTHNVLLY